ncbi:hypothetical protein Psta_3438 [Pirellula staleyi DSM 6068]|uniref:Uncharacterized protein n=1 Tax=Pirellula staleyi (strain ATCC 27377 / DSM 6068 / ICPB 4128) TaxID=530564 RepID=D2QY24_PIRSD|nr:hypothetical protein Psta_3438 [Pirellula staleyi DSM 6068]
MATEKRRGGGGKVHRCRPGDRVTVSGCKHKPVVRIGSDGTYYVSVSASRKTKIKTKGVER